jgi:eukaryotic-like serine/threonine-protein kinase
MKIGKVSVLEEIGKGAGSRVYRVRRNEDSREYALKVVPYDNERAQRYLEQVQNEYRIGNRLDHPNIVEIYCLEIEKGWFSGPKKANLLTQFVPGRTMDRLPLLPMPRLLRIFERIASAVAHMHARQVIHADLKPSNLILGIEADVKVIDLGIAQLRGEQRSRIHATREFMAPETLAHKMINERTDIYNFGATMFRLATLQSTPPVLSVVKKGEREFERRYKAANILNPRVPIDLSELIGDCLNFQPDLRPANMNEVLSTLARLARDYNEVSETRNPA